MWDLRGCLWALRNKYLPQKPSLETCGVGGGTKLLNEIKLKTKSPLGLLQLFGVYAGISFGKTWANSKLGLSIGCTK